LRSRDPENDAQNAFVGKSLVNNAWDMGDALLSVNPFATLIGRKGTYALRSETFNAASDLASAIVAPIALDEDQPVKSLTEKAFECLASYDWPGNVRELHNVLIRAAVNGADPLADHDIVFDSKFVWKTPVVASAAENKYREILAAVEEADGDVKEAMASLGMPKTSFYRAIKEGSKKIDPKKRLFKAVRSA